MSDPGPAKAVSKYAWREITRRDLPRRDPGGRVSDFLEIYGLFDEDTAREQASRCIQCPNPSCTGGCPLCNPIPEWMALTAEGRFGEAAALLGANSSIAEICARLCPRERLCEESCLLGGTSEAVAIASVEQFLAEYALQGGGGIAVTAPPNGMRVAVVGAGLDGLACADHLAKLGYSTTIFDSSDRPGGSLIATMPTFKLERSVVERRVAVLQRLGVVFKLRMAPGKDLKLGALRTDFDAVFLGFESRKPRELKVPGSDLSGVMPARRFVLQENRHPGPELTPLNLSGRRVLVIGGGEGAMDAARTAVRRGAAEVTCVYRRGEGELPCAAHDYQDARDEGVRFEFRAAPVAVLPAGAGLVGGVRFVRTEPGVGGLDGAGRPALSFLAGSEFELKADLVLAALGWDPLACPLDGDFDELARNDWGGVIVDLNQATNLPNVFAGGDIVRGPCMVLYAVRDARRAASGIHASLSAKPRVAV